MEPNGEPEERGSRGRETFLAVMLTIFLGGAGLIFLIFVSGGFFAWVILVSLALGVFGSLHYLLWGRMFNREVQGEREELDLQREIEARETQRLPWERRF